MAISFDVKKFKDDMLQIAINNNKEAVDAISSLPSKKFNPISRSYLISKKDVPRLLTIYSNRMDEGTRFELEKVTRIPMTHQDEAKDFLISRKKAILADEMGGGKTFSSILGANEVAGKKLVVCPSGLKYNWEKEISLVTDAEINIIEDTTNWISPDENGWTIISYDLLREHINSILNECYSVAIFDEAHYCRAVTRKGEPKSFRAKMLLEVSNNVEYLFLLTGTPVVNGNKDLFILLKAIGHDLAYSWSYFSSRYCGAKVIGKRMTYDSNSNEEELYSLLQYRMLRRLKDDFVDLPPKIREFIPVNVNLKDYIKKVNEYMDERSHSIEKGRHLVFLNAMRNLIAKEKVNHTIDLADNLVNKGESVVIFTNFKSVINKVMNHYGNIAVRITGEDTPKQRQESVNKFQNGEAKVIVCNIIAGGVGITLTRSSHLIMNDLSWLPAEHLQAEDRIHRIGKQENCHIYYMYTKDTIDEKMAHALENRVNSISRTLNGIRESFVENIIEMFN